MSWGSASSEIRPLIPPLLLGLSTVTLTDGDFSWPSLLAHVFI